ncbi:MAG TPA: hypothetical protein VEA19_04575, partial [Actinomycetota bacterium]|nr:hypothetical protein [Actinomycetota bacterium]
MTPRKETKSTSKKTASSKRNSQAFTAEERAAMKERARELKAEWGRGSRGGKTDGESALLEKIAEMKAADRSMAKRIHEIVKASAPEL